MGEGNKSFDLQLFSSNSQTYNGIGNTGVRVSAVMGHNGYFTGTARIQDASSLSGNRPGIKYTTIDGISIAATYDFDIFGGGDMIFYLSEEISDTVEITCNGGGYCKYRLHKLPEPRHIINLDWGTYNYGGSGYGEWLDGDKWLSYILDDKTFTITIQFIF